MKVYTIKVFKKINKKEIELSENRIVMIIFENEIEKKYLSDLKKHFKNIEELQLKI